MDKSIARVLKIKNEIEISELKIEDCSDYSEALNEYFVVLDMKNVADVRSFLIKDYKTFEKEIENAFDDFNEKGDTSGLLKILEIYKDGGSYTEAILEENGGLEAILGKNINIGINNPSIEEDEEEMYREMYEELLKKHEAEIQEKDNRIAELETRFERVKPLVDAFENLDDLEYDDIDMIATLLQELNPNEMSDLVFDIVEQNALPLLEDPNYNIKNLPILTIIMNLIANWFESREVVGEGSIEF